MKHIFDILYFKLCTYISEILFLKSIVFHIGTFTIVHKMTIELTCSQKNLRFPKQVFVSVHVNASSASSKRTNMTSRQMFPQPRLPPDPLSLFIFKIFLPLYFKQAGSYFRIPTSTSSVNSQDQQTDTQTDRRNKTATLLRHWPLEWKTKKIFVFVQDRPHLGCVRSTVCRQQASVRCCVCLGGYVASCLGFH